MVQLWASHIIIAVGKLHFSKLIDRAKHEPMFARNMTHSTKGTIATADDISTDLSTLTRRRLANNSGGYCSRIHYKEMAVDVTMRICSCKSDWYESEGLIPGAEASISRRKFPQGELVVLLEVHRMGGCERKRLGVGQREGRVIGSTERIKE